MNEIDDPEARLRRALGLQSKSASMRTGASRAFPPQSRVMRSRRNHKFVQDGDIPVVVLNARRHQDGQSADSRAASLSPAHRKDAEQSAVDTERAARQVAERSLADAQNMIRDLQTRLAHAEFARSEADESARGAKSEIDGLHATLGDRAHQ